MPNPVRLLFVLLCCINAARSLFMMNFRNEFSDGRGFWFNFFMTFNLITQLPSACYFLWLVIGNDA